MEIISLPLATAGFSVFKNRGQVLGDLDHEVFEAVSEVDVLHGDHDLSALRYQSDIRVDSPDRAVSSICWHTDGYRRTEEDGWRVVWSQATALEPDVP